MPIGAPIIAALISAAATATTTGLEAAGTFRPSTTAATEKAKMEALQAQQKQQQTMEQGLFKHFAPDAQAQTGGALGDQSLSAMIAELSGTPGDINLAQSTVFGQNPSPGPGGSPTEIPPASGVGLSSTAVGGG